MMKEYKVVVDDDGSIRWYNHEGFLHREEGPAIEGVNGTKRWIINGKLHREDGPALEWCDGSKHWYINGKELTEEEFNNRNKKELTIAEIEQLLGYSIKIVRGQDERI